MKLSRFVVPAVLSLMGLSISRVAHADTITETTDFGNTRATARSLDGLFSSASNIDNDNVYGVGNPTAIVNGSIGVAADIDFFSFIGTTGQQYYFDVDGTASSFDSYLTLFDSTGAIVGIGDDMSNPFDPGSTQSSDSFLGVYTLSKSDTYYLSLSSFNNRTVNRPTTPATQLARPNTGETGSGIATDGNGAFYTNTTPNQDVFYSATGGTSAYTLNATLVTPEPSTYAMMALGLVALCVLGAKRKKGDQAV